MGLYGAKINIKILSLLASRTRLPLFSASFCAAEVQELSVAMVGQEHLQLLGPPACDKPQV